MDLLLALLFLVNGITERTMHGAQKLIVIQRFD
jgi:hypothetical protein